MQDMSPAVADPLLPITPTSQVQGTPDELAPAGTARGDNSQALSAPGDVVAHQEPSTVTSGQDGRPPAFTGTWVDFTDGRPAS